MLAKLRPPRAAEHHLLGISLVEHRGVVDEQARTPASARGVVLVDVVVSMTRQSSPRTPLASNGRTLARPPQEGVAFVCGRAGHIGSVQDGMGGDSINLGPSAQELLDTHDAAPLGLGVEALLQVCRAT